MTKEFLVSTANVAFFVDKMLAFTGMTSLNTSLSVSMEDQEVTGGKSNKTLYKYKYVRKISLYIEMAEWNLEFIAANVGSKIFEGLKDVFMIGECVTLTNGVGTLSKVPVGEVFVEKENGTKIKVTPTGSIITVGNLNAKVTVTYQYNTNTKSILIDAESSPMVGELVLTADKHNDHKGKVGEVQFHVPSFQLSGTFDISLDSSGTTTTKLDGDALAVTGVSCTDGTVYAYITEIPSVESSIAVNDIAATPSVLSLSVGNSKNFTIIGIKGGLYSNVAIDPADCVVTSDDAAIATVANGIVTAVSAGDTFINVTYGDNKDVIRVTVSA